MKVSVPGAAWAWPETVEGAQPGDELLIYADLPADVAMKVVLTGESTIDHRGPADPGRAPAGRDPADGPQLRPGDGARNAGILGVMQQQSGHFLASPYGGAFAVGNDDADVWGGLTGTEVGEAYGVGGLGLVGTGRGGGGTGEGTIGLGNTGLIGKGGGGGTARATAGAPAPASAAAAPASRPSVRPRPRSRARSTRTSSVASSARTSTRSATATTRRWPATPTRRAASRSSSPSAAPARCPRRWSRRRR
jgi:hypothetical protein